MKCRKCNSEMMLIGSNEILGYWMYACLNEDCNSVAVIDDRYDEIQWDEE